MAIFARKKKLRLLLISAAVTSLLIASVLIALAMRDQATFFFPPSDVAAGKVSQGQHFRLGGMIMQGSMRQEGETTYFTLTDFEHQISAQYTGVVPDLFKEGQGAVAEGSLNAQGQFIATKVLAKHDENYMPREVADSLKQQPQGAKDPSTD